MRLHAEAAGQGTDLVLVHGWGMNASVMTGLAGTLVDRFRVTLVELPGHGRSPWDPGWNDLDRWAEACLAVAPARAIWIGWSLGGLVSLAATLAAPERAAGLVQIASSPRFVRADDWPPGVVAETFEQFAASLIAEPAATLERFLTLQVLGSEAGRRVLGELRDAVRERPLPSLAGLSAGLNILRYSDLRRKLQRLAAPSLWVFGARDTLVPVSTAAAMPQLGARIRVRILARAAHAPLLSHPRETQALIAELAA